MKILFSKNDLELFEKGKINITDLYLIFKISILCALIECKK